MNYPYNGRFQEFGFDGLIKCVFSGYEARLCAGVDVLVEEEKRRVTVKGEGGTIPKKEAEIDVGSAGTAARFLTAMLGMSDGSYVIQASGQMKKRPMKDLFVLLEHTGAEIIYLEQEGFLPVKINGQRKDQKLTVRLDISRSTQFLSAMLLISPMLPQGLHIHIYIDSMNISMFRAFHTDPFCGICHFTAELLQHL